MRTEYQHAAVVLWVAAIGDEDDDAVDYYGLVCDAIMWPTHLMVPLLNGLDCVILVALVKMVYRPRGFLYDYSVWKIV